MSLSNQFGLGQTKEKEPDFNQTENEIQRIQKLLLNSWHVRTYGRSKGRFSSFFFLECAAESGSRQTDELKTDGRSNGSVTRWPERKITRMFPKITRNRILKVLEKKVFVGNDRLTWKIEE